MNGKFIVFEGIDGSGKTTIAKVFYKYLKSRNKKEPVLTCEPYKQGVGNDIRTIMKNYDTQLDRMTELFLFETARSEHVASIIKPALSKGRIVLCDRFTYSSCAYQGFAMGIDQHIINTLNDIATDGLKPDVVFWIDANIDDCMARNKKAEAKDSMPYDYYEKCRNYYQTQADINRNFIRINGNGTVDEVTNRVINTYERILGE